MRKKVLLALLLAAAAAFGIWYCFLRHNGDVLQLHGLVEIQEVRLASKLGGRVKNVLAVEGTLVEEGKVLVQFEAPELEAQKNQLVARVQAAEAALQKAYNGSRAEEKDLAHAAMKAAEARYLKMVAGYRVEEKDQARGELDIALAELDRAKREFERIKGLYPQAASKSDYDAALAAFNRWQGQTLAAKAKVTHMTTGFRSEEIAEARAEFERAKANYELVEAGTRWEDITVAEAQVAELRARLQEVEAQLREATVVTPEKCVIEVVAVRKGDVVPPNQPVVRVLRAMDLWVKAYVPEVELGKVQLGQTVEVTCDSFPDKRFVGKVTQIASISEFTPRNVQTIDERRHQVFAIKIVVNDPQGVFKSGMAAEVFIPLLK